MKKTFAILSLVAFAAISLSSCKKDYTCECTWKIEGAPTINGEIKDAKKSEAEDACKAIETTSKVLDPAVSCKLK